MRVTWLGDVLHQAHLQIVPLDGWQGRGRELSTINGVVAHHTATPSSSPDGSVAKLLRDGRADLPGPLCQLGLDRQGRFWMICDGKGNHNGYGMWGNQSIGIEAFNDGKGEPWPAVQLDAYVKGSAAILRHLKLNEGHVLAHRETDPRKPDPVGVDMDEFRRKVAALLHPSPQEDLLVAAAKDDNDARHALVRWWCVEHWGSAPTVQEQNDLAFTFGANCAYPTLVAITDHAKAKAFRSRRGW